MIAEILGVFFVGWVLLFLPFSLFWTSQGRNATKICNLKRQKLSSSRICTEILENQKLKKKKIIKKSKLKGSLNSLVLAECWKDTLFLGISPLCIWLLTLSPPMRQ